MTLLANTIEFNGRKAVINSYTEHPALDASRLRQLAEWQARFPNATVLCERLEEHEIWPLVVRIEGGNLAYAIGDESNA